MTASQARQLEGPRQILQSCEHPRRETNALRVAPRARFWFVFYKFLADFQSERDAVA